LASYPTEAIYAWTVTQNLNLRKINLTDNTVKTLNPNSGFSSEHRISYLAMNTKATIIFIAHAQVIYKMDPFDFSISEFAGQPYVSTVKNGVGTAATFGWCMGFDLSPDGTYLLVGSTYSIQKVSTQSATATTITATVEGTVEGSGPAIRIDGLTSLKISPSGKFALFGTLSGGVGGSYVRKLDLTETIARSSFVAGGTTTSLTNGIGAAARFNFPISIAISGDETYALVMDGSDIRKIVLSTSSVTTLAGGISSNTISWLNNEYALVGSQNAVSKINLNTGIKTVISGNEGSGSSSNTDGGKSVATYQNIYSLMSPSDPCTVPGYGSTPAGPCAQCPSNTYTITPGTCTPCPPNTASAPGSTGYTPLPGYYES
jgi:hypothetical protein